MDNVVVFPKCVCYAIEGNTVDRASMKNGRGWCENVSPTLNTQDRHAVCFTLHSEDDDQMNNRGQTVCYKK